MSYILDALRRADAERTRGQVPDLHARAGDALDDDTPEHRAGRMPKAAAAVVLAALAVALAAWWFLGRPRDEAAPPVAPAAIAPQPGLPASPAPAAPLPVSPAPMAALPTPLAMPMPTPVAAAPAAANAAPPAAPAPTITEAAAAPRPAARRAERPATQAAAAAPAVTPLADLPPDLRRALPPLRFGGAIGSPDPGSRLLIVDGALLHEGDEAAPGLRLREIRLRSAVVEFRGRLVEIPY